MTARGPQTLPVWLSAFADGNRGTDWGGVMAGSTLIAIPVIVFFLIVQGRMVSGLTAGRGEGMSRLDRARARAVLLPGFAGTALAPTTSRCCWPRASAASACSARTPRPGRRPWPRS